MSRNSLFALGDVDRLRAHLERGAALARRLDDPLRLGRVTAFQAHHSWAVGDPQRAIELAQTALGIAEAAGNLALRLLASFFLGQAQHACG